MNNLTQLRFTAATIILLFILSGTLPADIPAGYYDDAEGKVGAELKAALHNIINGHTEKSYGDARYILDETDQDPDNSNNVRVVYSNHSVSGTWDYGATWNREHIWAKSRGIGDVNNYTKGAGSDLHNLRACIPLINTARSNRWFAECSEPYQYNGVNTGSYTSSSQWIWKPRNEDKGDVARIIFYMAVRYEGGSDEPDLEVVDYFPYKYSNEPLHAKLSSLLQWHLDDPVDSWERNRNDIIHDYQNNRNPFIDRPEFAARIWSDTTELDTPVIFFSEYIEGSSFNKALEVVNTINQLPFGMNNIIVAAGKTSCGITLSFTSGNAIAVFYRVQRCRNARFVFRAFRKEFRRTLIIPERFNV